MQISRYYYHSNRNTAIVTFIKYGDIINIYIDFDIGDDEQVLELVITEDKLKTIPNLWLCYIASFFLTKNSYLSYYEVCNPVIYINKVWKNLYITNYYGEQEIDISIVSNILSNDDYIENILIDIDDITLINNELLYKLLEDKFLSAEELLLKCEMTVEKIRALNNIIPDNFPTDLYNVIYTKMLKV